MSKFRQSRMVFLILFSLTLLGTQADRLYTPSLRAQLESGKTVHILLLGVDARPGEIASRSDTMVLVSINRKIKKLVLISIPRDTRVHSARGSGKLNMVNQFEGPEAVCKAVANLLEVPVHYYALTNFAGFERLIDAMGGVYMEVDVDLKSYSSGGSLRKGYQHLNGKQALKYARYRSPQEGDIGRTRRQQILLKAIGESLTRKENLPRLPALINQVRENIDTNVSPADMLYLATLAPGFRGEDVIMQTLPGYHYMDPYSGASYWEVDRAISRSLIDSLFSGHRFEVNLPPPPGGKRW